VWNVYRIAMTRHNKKFGAALRLVWLSLCLFGIVLGAVFHYVALAPRHSAVTNTVRHRGSRFVFADLDGDRLPDLALVETQRQRSIDCDYAIRVRLSAGAESAIGVSGPSGGLRVAVRDVNGDNNLDLIVTADLDAGFIKVLLNDGHGNFSVAAPTDFLRKENQSQVAFQVRADTRPDHGMLDTIFPSRGDTNVQPSLWDQVLPFETCTQSAVRPALKGAALSRFGRSPPTAAIFW
jgi:hypothetical protein